LFKETTIMDTSKLVVGQDVWVLVGEDIWTKKRYYEKGKVVEITERYVAVEFPGGGIRLPAMCLIRFDAVTGKTGTARDGLGYFDRAGGDWIQISPYSPGFWELTDVEVAPGR
jgi:hypothetical protein